MAFIDVVRWAGTPDVFAWRFPETNLTTFTQLIVHQTQAAVLFSKGAILQEFGPGKHTLSTENIPLLENLYGIPFGGNNPFTAEVWFVNKVSSLDVKWGTQQPFLVRDPEFGVMIPVRGYGQFGVRIDDARQFLTRLVGTLPAFDRERLVEYFRGLLLSRATALIARELTEAKCSVLDVAARIADLSEAIGGALRTEFAEYGIELLNFYLSRISVPEDDPAVVKLRDTLSKRAEMNILGYTYQQERSYDVLQDAAQNEGSGSGLMNAGLGLGMGMGVGQAIKPMMQQVAGQTGQNGQNDPNGKPPATCASCGAQISDRAQFCPSCGRPVQKPRVVNCNRCGREIPAGAKFCPACGDAYNPCPACGADLPADAAACPACGAKLPAACPHCGATIAADSRFCPGCGRALQSKCPSCGADAASGQSFCTTCGAKLSVVPAEPKSNAHETDR